MTVVVDEFREDGFSLPDHNRFTVLSDFLRTQRGVESANHNGDAPKTIFASNLIRPFGRVGFHADGHQIRGLVVRDFFKPIIIEPFFNICRRQRGNHRGRNGFHLPRANVALHTDETPHAGMNDRQPKRLCRRGAGHGNVSEVEAVGTTSEPASVL